MQVRARKTFSSAYGMVRPGNIFSCDPGYAQEMVAIGNVEIVPDKLGPDRIQAHTTAPKIKAVKPDLTEKPPLLEVLPTAALPTDGLIPPSSVLPPARRSRRQT